MEPLELLLGRALEELKEEAAAERAVGTNAQVVGAAPHDQRRSRALGSRRQARRRQPGQAAAVARASDQLLLIAAAERLPAIEVQAIQPVHQVPALLQRRRFIRRRAERHVIRRRGRFDRRVVEAGREAELVAPVLAPRALDDVDEAEPLVLIEIVDDRPDPLGGERAVRRLQRDVEVGLLLIRIRLGNVAGFQLEDLELPRHGVLGQLKAPRADRVVEERAAEADERRRREPTVVLGGERIVDAAIERPQESLDPIAERPQPGVHRLAILRGDVQADHEDVRRHLPECRRAVPDIERTRHDHVAQRRARIGRILADGGRRGGVGQAEQSLQERDDLRRLVGGFG